MFVFDHVRETTNTVQYNRRSRHAADEEPIEGDKMTDPDLLLVVQTGNALTDDTVTEFLFCRIVKNGEEEVEGWVVSDQVALENKLRKLGLEADNLTDGGFDYMDGIAFHLTQVGPERIPLVVALDKLSKASKAYRKASDNDELADRNLSFAIRNADKVLRDVEALLHV
jgi:hypothetical protein